MEAEISRIAKFFMQLLIQMDDFHNNVMQGATLADKQT